MKSLVVKDFDIAATMRSGHIFVYDVIGSDKFRIFNGRKSFLAEQRGKTIFYSGISEGELRRFFDLDKDVDALHRRLGNDPALRRILPLYRGVRLVRQDVRQAITTFILSSNNNQKRIKGMVDRHRAARRRTEAEYARLGFGYRAAYLCKAEKLLSKKFLEKLNSCGYDDARELLMTLPGVGPKVADCVLAYSELAKGEAFPVDVWVRRAVKAWYGDEFKGKAFTDRNIQEFARRKFGRDAAYAQHYLFLAAQEFLKGEK